MRTGDCGGSDVRFGCLRGASERSASLWMRDSEDGCGPPCCRASYGYGKEKERKGQDVDGVAGGWVTRKGHGRVRLGVRGCSHSRDSTPHIRYQSVSLLTASQTSMP